jgi:hypothetical protein
MKSAGYVSPKLGSERRDTVIVHHRQVFGKIGDEYLESRERKEETERAEIGVIGPR